MRMVLLEYNIYDTIYYIDENTADDRNCFQNIMEPHRLIYYDNLLQKQIPQNKAPSIKQQ